MSAKPHLRPVSPDERRKKPLTVTEAAAAGDTLAELVATRLLLARQLEESPPAYAAPISRQLREVAREIDALRAKSAEEGEHAVSTDDEEWAAI